MRRSGLRRHLLATTLPVGILLVSGGGTAVADPLYTDIRSTFGMPGGVETPTAEKMRDGTLAATVSYSGYALRNNVAFQVLPNLTAALRYSRIDGLDPSGRGYVWDRSFDLRYQLFDEQGWRPAVAIGMEDFLGTGIYSGEYVVATKNLTPNIRGSIGLGWGRLAGTPRPIEYGDEGGKPNYDTWFSGSPKPFGSVTWDVNDKLSLTAEYSNDDYGLEVENGADSPYSQINLSANYKFGRYYDVNLYTIGGKTFGAQFSLSLSPDDAPFPSGLEPAPAPVRPRPSPAADPEGWSGIWAQDPTAQPAIQEALRDAMADEGQVLESMALSANRAEVRFRNNRYLQQAEAIGRVARLMTRAMPASVDTFVITSSKEGMPTSSLTVRRADIERLEDTEAGEIAAAAVLSDAVPYPDDLVYTPDLFPRFRWQIAPYLSTSLFDPEDPLRFEVGLDGRATYEIVPGVLVAGLLRQRVFGNITQEAPGGLTVDEYEAMDNDYSETGVPRVRSDGRMYSGNNYPRIPFLTLSWYARPSLNTYSRVTAGLLEKAYGGVSAEVLWKPVNSPLAFGAEVNRVRKRDFDDLFAFRDYEATTAFVSAYYEFQQGYTVQLDAGQYLAGDVGATLSLSREFANGWRVGAYVTKTDMSEEDFGEGSFDKGIGIWLPITWATGQPSRERIGGNLSSLSRDGGARVRVPGRLYDRIRDSHSVELYQGWGKFWR